MRLDHIFAYTLWTSPHHSEFHVFGHLATAIFAPASALACGGEECTERSSNDKHPSTTTNFQAISTCVIASNRVKEYAYSLIVRRSLGQTGSIELRVTCTYVIERTCVRRKHFRSDNHDLDPEVCG